MKRCAHRVEQRLTGCLFEAERLRNGGHNQLRITERGQVHEKHTIAEPLHEFGCHLQPQAGFADATRPGEGHEAYLWSSQERTHCCHFPFAPDERRELHRQAVPVTLQVACRLFCNPFSHPTPFLASWQLFNADNISGNQAAKFSLLSSLKLKARKTVYLKYYTTWHSLCY